MKTRSIASAAIAAVMVFAVAAPATVLAGDRNHGGGHHSSHNSGHHGGHQRRHQGGHQYKHRNRHHNQHRGYGGHATRYYRKDKSHEKLLIGLVVGGILGYAINESTHGNNIDYGRRSRSFDDFPVDDGYRKSASRSRSSSSHSCLQEREYQTTVIVGGREVDAYGTACLQPDGSWTRRPATLASY